MILLLRGNSLRHTGYHAEHAMATYNGDAENAGLENAGLENSGPKCRGGKRRTGKRETT